MGAECVFEVFALFMAVLGSDVGFFLLFYSDFFVLARLDGNIFAPPALWAFFLFGFSLLTDTFSFSITAFSFFTTTFSLFFSLIFRRIFGEYYMMSVQIRIIYVYIKNKNKSEKRSWASFFCDAVGELFGLFCFW